MIINLENYSINENTCEKAIKKNKKKERTKEDYSFI